MSLNGNSQRPSVRGGRQQFATPKMNNLNALEEVHRDITTLFALWTRAWLRTRLSDLSSALKTHHLNMRLLSSRPFSPLSPAPCLPLPHHPSSQPPSRPPSLSISPPTEFPPGRENCVANAWTTRYLSLPKPYITAFIQTNAPQSQSTSMSASSASTRKSSSPNL